MPKGKELSSPSIGNQLAGTLDALRLESVLPAAQAEPELAQTYLARYVTFEGLVVTVTAWEKDAKGYARFNASLDTGLSEAYLMSEQSKAEAAANAQAAAAAPPASGVPAVLTPPAKATFDAAKFRTEKLAELTKQVDEINKRTTGWTYVLVQYKFAGIKKTMADMLKVEGAEPAAGTEENPITFPINQ